MSMKDLAPEVLAITFPTVPILVEGLFFNKEEYSVREAKEIAANWLQGMEQKNAKA